LIHRAHRKSAAHDDRSCRRQDRWNKGADGPVSVTKDLGLA
jgi:hypothetical protein